MLTSSESPIMNWNSSSIYRKERDDKILQQYKPAELNTATHLSANHCLELGSSLPHCLAPTFTASEVFIYSHSHSIFFNQYLLLLREWISKEVKLNSPFPYLSIFNDITLCSEQKQTCLCIAAKTLWLLSLFSLWSPWPIYSQWSKKNGWCFPDLH